MSECKELICDIIIKRNDLVKSAFGMHNRRRVIDMNKIRYRILVFVAVFTMAFALSSCSKEEVYLNANWVLTSLTVDGETRSADLTDINTPRFFCDDALNVIFYNNGEMHFGKAQPRGDRTFRIDYQDSDKCMLAEITNGELVITIEGSDSVEMRFALTDERTLIPISDSEEFEGIEAKFVTLDPLTVSFKNNTQEQWVYSEYYRIEKLDGGIWYLLPPNSPVTVRDMAHEIGPNMSSTLSYDLTPYGNLEDGEYRIACGTDTVCYAYFTIE